MVGTGFCSFTIFTLPHSLDYITRLLLFSPTVLNGESIGQNWNCCMARLVVVASLDHSFPSPIKWKPSDRLFLSLDAVVESLISSLAHFQIRWMYAQIRLSDTMYK